MKIEPKPVAPGNFKKGRGGRKPDVIVIHISEGTMSSMENWFANPDAKVSSHYAVGRDGRVVQFVQDGDQAYHAGRVESPTAEIVRERPSVNPNSYSLGIENAGFATQEPTAEQMDSLVELVHQLALFHKIPLTRRHIIGHREIRADKTCPGKIDVDEVVRRAVALATKPAPSANAEVLAALDEIERQTAIIRRKLA